MTAAGKILKLRFKRQNAVPEDSSERREQWCFFKPLFQPRLQPLCMLTRADRACSDQSTDNSVL